MMQLRNNRLAGSRILVLSMLLVALTAAFIVLAAAAQLATPAVAATTFAVDRNDDPDPATANACTDAANDCSLRGAIVAANAAAGADDVTVPAGTYTLTREGAFEEAASTGDLDITGELTIAGAGARATSVVGGPAPFEDRIFDNQSGAKTSMSGLSIAGGNVGAYEGGGIRNQGDLTLDGMTVKDNTAGSGGGIDSRNGDLTLDGVTVEGNTATTTGFGGGVYSERGTLNITDSTVSSNSAKEIGGGVYHLSGLVNITNTTVSGNKAAQLGGGVVVSSATMNVLNSTIASNASGGVGGGIFTGGPGSTVVVKNTIVAGNTLNNCDNDQFGGAIVSQGNNISSDDSCSFTQSTDKPNTNPRLGPLQDKGGPTDTRALLAGSPAIDAGANAACPTTDQRGAKRPQNGDKNGSAICDIGAFEKKDLTPPKVTATVPTAGKTGVKRNANLKVTFSEQMNRATLTKSTFKLFKVNPNGTTTQVTNVTVSPAADGPKAVLNPFGTTSTLLAANTRYRAVVTTGAKDLAGNGLDQNRTATGSQSMVWTFTTGSS